MLIHEVSRISLLPTVESNPGSGCRTDVLGRLCFEWATKRKGYWGPYLISGRGLYWEECIGKPSLGSPVERLNKGTRFFSVVHFSRGTLLQERVKGHYWGT